jgi:hypothetical protein
MKNFNVWLGRGNAGWLMASIGFIIIAILIITED